MSNARNRVPFFVFDLDGTLADIAHRVHYVRGGQRNYDAFFDACIDDAPNLPVITALNAHYDAGHRVEIWSARSDVVRHETEAWLVRHGIDPIILRHMRAAGDTTPDVILKRRWLHELHDTEWPDAVYDDRQSVVDMWRDAGIPCFQVAPNWEGPRPIAPVREQLLTVMVGPSCGGKSTWAAINTPSCTVSSDGLRQAYCGDVRDQSRNEDVFAALHTLAKARLTCGLPVTIDATNLRRRDRLACVALAPAGTIVRYVVCNRPMANKLRDAGWRADVKIDDLSLIEAHEQRFNSAIKDILAGDGMPNVVVTDARNTSDPDREREAA